MEELKFEFGKYTEVTEFAKEHGTFESCYTRFFVCTDTWDYWFIRLLVGYDEDYNPCEGAFLIERNNIPKDNKTDMITLAKLKEIVEEDDGSNYDYEPASTEEEALEMIDGGFGILNLVE